MSTSISTKARLEVLNYSQHHHHFFRLLNFKGNLFEFICKKPVVGLIDAMGSIKALLAFGNRNIPRFFLYGHLVIVVY